MPLSFEVVPVQPPSPDGFLDRLRNRPHLPVVSADTRTLVRALSGALIVVLIGAASVVYLQSGQIDTLKSCLSGVQTAFSDFLGDDYDHALTVLYSVQTDCDNAYALF